VEGVLLEGGDDRPGRAFLKFLHEATRALSGLGLDKQMKVLGHEYPTDQQRAGLSPKVSQDFDERPTEARAVKQPDAPLGAGGDKLRVNRRALLCASQRRPSGVRLKIWLER